MQQNIGYNPQGALLLRVVITCGIKLLGTVVEKLCKTFYKKMETPHIAEQIDADMDSSPLHNNITTPQDYVYDHITHPIS